MGNDSSQRGKREKPQAAPPKPRKVPTTLDTLPAGSAESFAEKASVKKPLPEGVSSGMLYKDIVRIGWPAFVELMLTQMTSMADLMMVGKLGPWAISAVGLTAQPKFLLATSFISLNVGTMSMVGRYRGAGEREKAQLVLRQAFMLNTFLGFVFALIGLIFSKQLVAFMGAADEQVLIAGTQYFRIQMAGLFTVAITTAMTNSLRGSGDSRTAMIYNTVANVVNVVLNYLLIYGNLGFPRMEVAGASLATVIAQSVACLMAIAAVRKKSQYVRLEFPRGSIHPDKECIGNIARIGIPSMIEQVAMRIGVIIFTKTITGLGTTAYATHQICMNIQALTFMNGQAFSTSATALVSQSLGKNRPDMAMHYSRRAMTCGLFTSLFIAVCVFVFNGSIIGLYTDDAVIIATGGALLQMIAFIQPFQSSQFILAGSLRGAGDTKYTAMVTSLTVMLLRPSLAIFFIKSLDLGLYGAWFALVADQILRTTLIAMRYISGKWVNAFKTRHIS